MSNSSDIGLSMSDFMDLSLDNHSLTDSEFTIIGRRTPSQSETDAISSLETISANDGSQLDIITIADSTSEVGINFDALSEVDKSSIRTSSPSLAPKDDSPTCPLTRENLTWVIIKDVAGGSVQRYSQMIIDDLKAKGVNFPPDAEIPAEGESMGDLVSGYEKMTLGAKLWSWWTRKQRSILDSQISKELRQLLEIEASNIAKTPMEEIGKYP